MLNWQNIRRKFIEFSAIQVFDITNGINLTFEVIPINLTDNVQRSKFNLIQLEFPLNISLNITEVNNFDGH